MKMKYFFFLIILLFRLLPAQESEYRVKAALVEKITRFVEWPDEQTARDSSSFVLCVIGDSPILPYLQELSRKKNIKNKNVRIIHIEKFDSKLHMDVLFISRSERKKLKSILDSIKNKNILTISDTPGFAKKGVMVNFYDWKGFIRFEINKKAVESSNLKFSSRLLRLARIVE